MFQLAQFEFGLSLACDLLHLREPKLDLCGQRGSSFVERIENLNSRNIAEAMVVDVHSEDDICGRREEQSSSCVISGDRGGSSNYRSDAVEELSSPAAVIAVEIRQIQNRNPIPKVNMASNGSQSYVRGRAPFHPPRPVGSQGSERVEHFRLRECDYDKIVSYLEVTEHFNAVTGAGKKTTVGGKYQTKTTVFKGMLAALQHHGFPKEITAGNLIKRYQRYMKRYRDARDVKMDTGGGVTDKEMLAGVTLEEKLEHMCPHFNRMHALFGGRPNVDPPTTGDVGVDDVEIVMPVDTGDDDTEMLDEQENVNPNCDDTQASDESHVQQYSPTVMLEGNGSVVL